MQPFDGSNSKSILIMDNCSIHHVGPVQEVLQDAGVLVFFLPPNSPDFKRLSVLKYYLKNHDQVLQSVTDSDAITIVLATIKKCNATPGSQTVDTISVLNLVCP